MLIIEMPRRDVLHAVYTCNLSIEDAARLKSQMIRKRKINLVVLLLELMVFLGCIMLLIISGIYKPGENKDAMFAFFLLIVSGLITFPPAFSKYFIANSCLKALRVAYPNLPPHIRQWGESKEFIIDSPYNPGEYRTDKWNSVLMDYLESGKMDEAKVRGLLNYAIVRRGGSFRRILLALALSIILLAVCFFFFSMPIQALDETGNYILCIVFGECGVLLLLATLVRTYRWKVNSKYLEVIKVGYPHLFEDKA